MHRISCNINKNGVNPLYKDKCSYMFIVNGLEINMLNLYQIKKDITE